MARISKKSSPPETEVEDIVRQVYCGFVEGLAPEWESMTHVPNVDIISTPSEVIVEAEMPGVRKEDIEVYFAKNTLVLRALKFECFEEDKINYVCMERVFGRLWRSVELPFPVDSTRIKAVYRNGLLTITIPRVPGGHGSRVIDIDAAE